VIRNRVKLYCHLHRTVRILRILYNSLFVVGVYEALEAHILSVGANLPCTDPTTISIDISSSDDNLSGLHNRAVIDLGYLPNIALAESDVLVEENKVHFVFYKYIPSHLNVPKGSQGR